MPRDPPTITATALRSALRACAPAVTAAAACCILILSPRLLFQQAARAIDIAGARNIFTVAVEKAAVVHNISAITTTNSRDPLGCPLMS